MNQTSKAGTKKSETIVMATHLNLAPKLIDLINLVKINKFFTFFQASKRVKSEPDKFELT